MTDNPIVELAVDESFATPAAPDQVERAAESLRRNGFTAHIVDTVEEAHTLVTDLLPTDKTIFTSTSETLRLSGLAETINSSGTFRSLRAEQSDWDLSARHDDVRVTRSAPEVVIGSVHAVTEDGKLVTASASGSQLAPYASGATQAVWVVGAQKVVPDLATALHRIETYSYPKEDVRAQHAYGVRSTISKILINGRELVPGRGTVVLIREAIGF
ncbi:MULTISPECIES: LUD domain-containing protein [Rhodococcus]|uniref:LUD domain-containing protein n=1 Tax=Rhodococcus opacus TaxID=37919 RepID=A0A076EGA1_RHOOP|nr:MULTISPECIES: LUD domain-containing protein [Rhodococcus]AII04133.1 hypothetical protein EP51_05780 [Rhodococcus opacus]WAM15419.1 LUD domain-containing protein [Rhodococcus sp. JS3073]